jgi:thiaminase
MTMQEVVETVETFRGECFNDYENIWDYVSKGGWEKDYFSAWLDGCSDYPFISEIKDFCEAVDELLTEYTHYIEENSNTNALTNK